MPIGEALHPGRAETQALALTTTDAAVSDKSGVTPQVLAVPTGEGSVQGLGESFVPQLNTGTASFRIPVQLPPARGGVQPSLSFTYDSGGGQALAGEGWSVPIPAIARRTDKGLPRYDGLDRFALDGDELVEVQPGRFLPDPAARQFRARIEGRHWRYFFIPASAGGAPTWMAQDKDGTTYYFGGTAGSRIENEAGVFRWSLTQVVDVHGNRAVYEWVRDGDGQTYLTAILYNEGAGGVFRDRVGFEYEGRGDVLTSFVSGYPVRTVRRLSAVTVDTEYAPSEDRRRVRSYRLGYDQDSYHSLLASIQLFGNDDVTSYPPVTFGYTQVEGTDTAGRSDPSIAIPGYGELDASIHLMADSPARSVNEAIDDLLDVDGDSLPDLFVTDLSRNGGEHTWVKNTMGAFEPRQFGTGFAPGTGERILPNGNQLSLANRNVQLLDMDGDGRAEMLNIPRMLSYNYYRLGDPDLGWLQCDSTHCAGGGDAPVSSIPMQSEIDYTLAAEDIRLMDVNGDRLVDVVLTTTGATKVWLNLGGIPGWAGRFGRIAGSTVDTHAIETCALYKGTFVRFSDPRVQLGDMNGDGIQDIVLLDRGDIVYWPGRGYGSFGVGSRSCPAGTVGSNRHVSMGNSPYFSDLNLASIRLGDVNGDELTDLVEVMADSVRIWLNEGGASFSAPLLVERTPDLMAFSSRLRFADMNGSGSTDLVWGDAGSALNPSLGYRYIDFTGGVKPRVLDRIDNGLGKVLVLEWQSSPAHERDACTERPELCESPFGVPQWHDHTPFATQVLRRTEVHDSIGSCLGDSCTDEGVYTTEYLYFDPYYEGTEHEFRGFGYVETVQVGDANTPTAITRSWMYRGKAPEDEALKGQVYRTEVVAADEPQVVESTVVTQWTVQELEEEKAGSVQLTPLRIVRQAFASNSYSFLYDTAAFASEAHSESLTLGRYLDLAENATNDVGTIVLPAVPEAVTRTSTTIDAFGNEVEKLEHGRVEPGYPAYYLGDERYTFTEWVHSEVTWVHRPTHTVVTGVDVNETYNDTYYCYDHYEPCGGGDLDLGDVTREQVWVRDPVNGDRWITRVENEYDAYGHVIRTITGGSQERRFDYGDQPGFSAHDPYAVYPSGEHVVAGAVTLTSRAMWDSGFGQIFRYEDPNYSDDSRALTTVEYDALGRVHRIFRPNVDETACPDLASTEVRYGVGAPLSRKAVFTREVECKPGVLTSVSYTDGLGRVREALAEAEDGRWIVSGYGTFDARGQQREAYQPFFAASAAMTDDVGAPESYPEVYIVDASASPFSSEHHDAFARAVEVIHEDGTSRSVTVFHALSKEQWDEEDADPTSQHYGTFRTQYSDGLGRVLGQRDIQGGDGGLRTVTWNYHYDPVDDLVSIVDPANNVRTQTYDSLGRRVRLDDPNAGTWTFSFDDAGNAVSRLDGRGVLVVLGYDGAGRLASESYFAADGSPYPGMETGVDYHYDLPRCAPDDTNCAASTGGEQARLKGRLSWVDDLTGASNFSYDTRGRIERRTRTVGGVPFSSLYAYDDLHRETSVTYPDGDVLTSHYDSRGLLEAVGRPGDPTPAFIRQIKYSAAGLREETHYGDAVETVRSATYDVRLRPSTLRVAQSLTGEILLDESYELDRVGDFTAIHDLRTASTVPGIDPTDRTMTYDDLYELKTMQGRFGLASYGYDDVGNLTKAVIDDGGKPTGGAFFEKTPGDYTYGRDCPAPHRPYAVCMVENSAYSGTAAPGFAWFEYDDAGNMIEAQIERPNGGGITELRLGWDAVGRLVSAERVENGNATHLSFAYDYSGARVVKQLLRRAGTVSPTECGRAGSTVPAIFNEDETVYLDPTSEIRSCRLTKYVYAGGRRIAQMVTEVPEQRFYRNDDIAPYTFFYHGDHLGSTSTLTEASGALVNHITYHPYGSPEREWSGTQYDFSADYLFTGKELDREGGLFYFGARYYLPEIGRWISPDPLFLQAPEEGASSELELNIYSFVHNAPTNGRDTTGLRDDSAWFAREIMERRRRAEADAAREHEAALGAVAEAARALLPDELREDRDLHPLFVDDAHVGWWRWNGEPAIGYDRFGNDLGIIGSTSAGAEPLSLLEYLDYAAMVTGVYGGLRAAGRIALTLSSARLAGREFAAVSREYWMLRGPANGRSLHHWLIPQSAKWAPLWLKNAGWNLVELPAARGVFHRTLGLNQWMGFAKHWGFADRFAAHVVENGIRLGIPMTIGGGAYIGGEIGLALEGEAR